MVLERTAIGGMRKIVNGLVGHYGFKLDSPEILYGTLHFGVDEEDMRVDPYAVERYAVRNLEQAAVRKGPQPPPHTFWLVYDCILRFFGDNNPLYAAWRETVGTRA